MIDLIHDVGEAYRKLVNANSYPGRVYNVAEYTKKAMNMPIMMNTTQLLGFMLLDAEVSFNVVGEGAEKVEDFFAKLTFAKRATVEVADFIILLATATIKEKQEAMGNAKIGTLVDPQLSATIICETQTLIEGDGFELTGPGVKESIDIRVHAFKEWDAIMKNKNVEFPLGIELYFVDESSNLMALTRTTQIKRKGCEQ